MGRGRRGGEEGVGKGVEDGGKHKEGGLVSDPPPQSATCAVGGLLAGPAGKEAGSCPGTVAGPRHADPPPVGVGGNGWRCPYDVMSNAMLHVSFSHLEHPILYKIILQI